MPICLYRVVILKNTSGAVRRCAGVVSRAIFLYCFINDLELCLKAIKLYLFANDGKAVGEILSNNGTVDIQADLDVIAEWSEVNQLPLSLPKCCCIHYRKKNPNHKYTIGSQEMISTVEHEDLGILRTADFVYSKHVAQLALKVNKLSGMNSRPLSQGHGPSFKHYGSTTYDQNSSTLLKYGTLHLVAQQLSVFSVVIQRGCLDFVMSNTKRG